MSNCLVSEGTVPSINTHLYNLKTHFNANKRLGFLSSKLGYNCCVVSMASPILPAKTNFWIPVHQKTNKRLGFFSSKLGYSCYVVSMGSPLTLPKAISEFLFTKTNISSTDSLRINTWKSTIQRHCNHQSTRFVPLRKKNISVMIDHASLKWSVGKFKNCTPPTYIWVLSIFAYCQLTIAL